jgi:hypothetical protein
MGIFRQKPLQEVPQNSLNEQSATVLGPENISIGCLKLNQVQVLSLLGNINSDHQKVTFTIIAFQICQDRNWWRTGPGIGIKNNTQIRNSGYFDENFENLCATELQI